jgi:hypothetical protein
LETCLLDSCPVKSIQDIIDSGVYPPGDDTREWLDAMVDYPLSPAEDPACASYEQMKTDGESLVLSMMQVRRGCACIYTYTGVTVGHMTLKFYLLVPFFDVFLATCIYMYLVYVIGSLTCCPGIMP